jgi:hypothetical protein
VADYYPSLPGDIGSATLDFSLTNPAFNAAPLFSDVIQSSTADCYFAASLAAIAIADPDHLYDLVQDNTETTGTFRISLRDLATHELHYVHVNGRLNSSGGPGAVVKHTYTSAIWPPIIEKAYAYFFTRNASPSNQIGPYTNPQNTYASMNIGGDPLHSLQFLGYLTQRYEGTEEGILDTIAAAIAAGKPTCFGPKAIFTAGGQPLQWYRDFGVPVVDAHIYAVHSVSANRSTITLYNPWGGHASTSATGPLNPAGTGLVTLTAAQFIQCVGGIVVGYDYITETITPPPPPPPPPTEGDTVKHFEWDGTSAAWNSDHWGQGGVAPKWPGDTGSTTADTVSIITATPPTSGPASPLTVAAFTCRNNNFGQSGETVNVRIAAGGSLFLGSPGNLSNSDAGYWQGQAKNAAAARIYARWWSDDSTAGANSLPSGAEFHDEATVQWSVPSGYVCKVFGKSFVTGYASAISCATGNFTATLEVHSSDARIAKWGADGQMELVAATPDAKLTACNSSTGVDIGVMLDQSSVYQPSAGIAQASVFDLVG